METVELFFPEELINLINNIIENKKDYVKIYNIRKSHGGYRRIISPTIPYKNLQRFIYKRLKPYMSNSELSYAWTEGRDRKQCMELHIGNKYKLESDVVKYFDNIRKFHILQSINFDLIMNIDIDSFIDIIMLKDKNDEYFLPQGYITSPMFANAVRYDIDLNLINKAREKNITISFYGDNIISSSNNVNDLVGFTKEIDNEFEQCQFKVKHKLYSSKNKQKILGFIVNEKVNMDRKYYLNILKELYTISNTIKIIPKELAGKINLLRLNTNPRDFNYITKFIKEKELQYE